MITKNSVLRLFSIFVLLVSIIVFDGSSSVLAKNSPNGFKPEAHNLQKSDQCLGSGARTAHHILTGKVRFVGTQPGQPIPQPEQGLRSASPEAAARGYLTRCGSLFGLSNQATEMAVKRQSKIDDGRSVIRFQQNYKGIPVFGGELLIQLDPNNDVILVNGDMLPDIKLNVQADIDASAAQQTAVQMVAAQYGLDPAALTVDDAKLRIYSPAFVESREGPAALVWQMEVRPQALAPIRELVLIDAHSGDLVFHFNQVDTAKNRLTYTASNTQNRPGTLVCNEANPTCSGGDTDAVNAHVYGGDTYDFYFNNYGRDSINGAGMALISTVHFDVNYCNAFWDGSQMTYGDGCFIVTDDVVGHEMTHGVTENESGLIYSYQSGAINESFSDIWGEFIDLSNGKGSDTAAVRWLMGEDTSIGAIRNMKDPTVFGDPDRMDSPNYYHGSGDNGGVHTNSGVGNKAAYLITDGDIFNGYTITGIGITKTAKVYYEAQTNILTSTSDYYSLYLALYQACNNLIGTSGITAANCTEVQEATLATEMDHYPPAPPPANDDIASPIVISSLPYSNTQSTTGATTAGNDPSFACVSGQKYNSVWYRYTAAASQTLTIDTFTSNYDTVLAVWTGSPGSLVSKACNDDISGFQSKVIVSVTAGVSYYIEIASYSSGGGTLTLNISGPGSGNDDIVSPVVISSLPYSNSQSTASATTAGSDPVFACVTGQKYNSVWYRYTPSVSQSLTIDTFTSSYDTVLAVWTGSSGSLVSGACNDDTSSLQSQLIVSVTAGVVYYIEIASFSAGGGTLVLHISGSDTGPSNDAITNPIDIESMPYANTQSTTGASTAGNDPSFACASGQRSNTVWYSYTPGSSQTLVVDTFGSSYDTVLAVWTGSPGSLVSVACSDETPGSSQSQVSVSVLSGVSYYIEVASYFSGGGTLYLNANAYSSTTFYSSAAPDGWIVESSETSGTGGALNKSASTLRLGDDAANRQYRSVLSFDTAGLPDNAVITSVTLKFKFAGQGGTLPFNTHGSLLADVRKGAFSNNTSLQVGDFKAVGSKAKVLIYTNNSVNGWYSQSFAAADFFYINPKGLTQFRLRFTKDDNNDFGADYLKIYSGNTIADVQPQLIIEYYLP